MVLQRQAGHDRVPSPRQKQPLFTGQSAAILRSLRMNDSPVSRHETVETRFLVARGASFGGTPPRTHQQRN